MIIECLVFVSLVISLVWLILYCMYLKKRLRDAEKWIRKVDGEQCNTRALLRRMGLMMGYELHESAEWVKKDIDIK